MPTPRIRTLTAAGSSLPYPLPLIEASDLEICTVDEDPFRERSMSKSDATVEQLVGMIERGELRLPEMQRRYVWRSTRVRDLLDSLYRGYPSGAILVWETDEEVPLQDMAVSQRENPYQTTRLLLDGQQRLTSLSAVVRGEPVSVRGRKRPVELLFNLEHPDELLIVTEVEEDGSDDDEEDDAQLSFDDGDDADSSDDELQQRFNRMTFVVSTRKLEQLPQWVKVTDVFKTEGETQFLKRAGVTDFEDPRFQKYSERLRRLREIKKYIYRMDVLERKLSYTEVTEIFVRVNSLGAKLRSSDLALAQITAKWKRSLATFEQFQADCQAIGFDLELGLHLKCLVSFATGQSRFKQVGGLPLVTLQDAWKQSCKGMEFALNFVKQNARITSPALLSSPFILITLAYFGHKRDFGLSRDEAQRLRQWLLLANAKGRYSRGSSETILDQDLATLRNGGGVSELMDRLRQQVGRLDILPEELEGRNQRSALFKTMFLAFQDAQAKDWNSQLAIALELSGAQHRLQFHHIFPKAVLRESYPQREADDIANLCFITGRTNRSISDKTPARYFERVLAENGPKPLEAQCIPYQDGLLEVDSYRDFLRERRRRIAARLNEFLDVTAVVS